MVKTFTAIRYTWNTFSLIIQLSFKMSIRMWFYLLMGSTTLIGSYCVLHILRNIWNTIVSIVMFAPKLYVQLVNYCMTFVSESASKKTEQAHHHHHNHNHSHNRVRTPVTPPPTPIPSGSSSERWTNQRFPYGDFVLQSDMDLIGI